MAVLICVILTLLSMAVSIDLPKIQLSNGMKMPVLALGTFSKISRDGVGNDPEVLNAVLYAIDAGYRHIDTAYIYGSEQPIGDAMITKINEGVVGREDMFITAKLWNTHHKRREVVSELRSSLHRLQTHYVDLYLMHWPMGMNEDYSYNHVDYMEAWSGMEDAVRMGLAKSIGLSNFNQEQIVRVLNEGIIKPVALQIEIHPLITQIPLVRFCTQHNIVVMGYSPFGTLVPRYGINFPGLKMDDPVLVEMAARYGKTVLQILLRWQIDRHIVPVPKSVTPRRISENIDIFDFQLTEQDIVQINKFNRNQPIIIPSFWQEHKYYPFERVSHPLPDPFVQK